MMPLRAGLSRVLSLLRRRSLDDRLENEIETHLEMATNEHIARGMPPEEARNVARRGFSGIIQTREAYHDAAGRSSVDGLWQDVRYAVPERVANDAWGRL